MALDREQFALALECHRKRLDRTQVKMAALLEVSPRVYWQWENGLCNALPVTMEGVIARLKTARKTKSTKPAK